MTRFVIDAEVALRLVREQLAVGDGHKLVAPALLKSQVLSLLYQAVQRGELTKKDADQNLNRLRELKIRYLSDRVSQATAWKLAARLGWPDTPMAEYLAVTTLQADAFVTLDTVVANSARAVVTVATMDELQGQAN